MGRLLVPVLVGLLLMTESGRAQEDGIERPGPLARDTFEIDENADGVPDGWYNLRDASIVDGGPTGRGKCFRFQIDKPGRPSRASRAFGVDGKRTEALIIGFWAKLENGATGERIGDDPGLVIDFLGDQLRATRRGTIGPLTHSVGPRWTPIVKRISVPPDTRDAILSIGLLGGTGTFEVDDLTIELVPVGGTPTDQLILNGDFELGDPSPASWTLENGAKRVTPGFSSNSACDLDATGARALISIGQPVDRFPSLEIRLQARGRELRGVDSVIAGLFFLDEFGRPLSGLGAGLPVFRWSGSFPWQPHRQTISVPRGASQAVLQIEKTSPYGTFTFDDVHVEAVGEVRATQWTPYHVSTDTKGWHPFSPSTKILKDSALDASWLLRAPAGRDGFVKVKDGGLWFTKGGRARFFGVSILPPGAILEREQAEALAERLARSGINLVRLGDLDAPIGPARSLIDDSREDTRELDPESLAKLCHLIAVLKERGIYVALELQSLRRYRSGDEVSDPGLLRNGGGAAAAFDPKLRKLQLDFASKLLSHVNPETQLALKDDPVLAWVTLAGELSLFDLIDDPKALPPTYATALKAKGTGRAAWKATESQQWKSLADDLRKLGVKVPIAGASHWRRESEFVAAQSIPGLDLIDDRLYWMPPTHGDPDRRSMLWSRDGGIRAGASLKRKSTHPYVVGQYCNLTGAWALPFEGADLLLAASTGVTESWDGLVRRGIFTHPEAWGASAPGTSGGQDLFPVPESLNANPQVFGLLPHATRLFLAQSEGETRTRSAPVRGWESRRGRLTIDTPRVQGIAGWFDGESAQLSNLIIDADSRYGVAIASSADGEPLSKSKRLLVTALSRIEPTGLAYADASRKEVAEIGRPPLLCQPVRVRIVWRTKKTVKAYALDNNGARVREEPIQISNDGPTLSIDGTHPGIHWELTTE